MRTYILTLLLLTACEVETDSVAYPDKAKPIIVYANKLTPDGQAMATEAVSLFEQESHLQAQTLTQGCAYCNPNIVVLSPQGTELELIMPKHEKSCAVLRMNGVTDPKVIAAALQEYVNR